MAIGVLINGIIASVINSFPNKKLLNYGYMEQLKDIFPSAIISLIMGIVIYPISLLNLNLVSIIFFQVLLGVIVYISISYAIKLECCNYLIEVVLKSKKLKRA